MQPQVPSAGLQVCPTRVDGAPVLFAHKVTAGQCQDRQRGLYHKCFTCVFNNAYVKHGERPAPAPAIKIPPLKRLQVG